LAFAGGRRRYLDVAGVLGFHRGTFAGMQEPKLDTVQRRVFRAAGFDSGFITRALSTPNEDIWTPPIETLVRARVVTDVDYGSMFDQR
jgi:hypothetical protein